MIKSILLYTSGDRDHGMGHIQRQLVLASELVRRGVRVGFETPPDTPGHKRILEWVSSLPDFIKRPPVTVNDYSSLYSAVLIDIENGPTRDILQQARNKFNRVIVLGGVGFPIQDQSAIDDLVDLQIYQSVAVNDVSRSVSSRSIVGTEYIIINPEYLELREIYGRAVMGHDVCVIMGGGDPHGITDVVCEAARLSCNGNGLRVRAVIGPAVDSPNRYLKFTNDIALFHAPPNLVRVFAGSRCLISALGMTTYEAMCIGLPVASINWSEDHEATAKKLEAKGATVNLGMWNAPDWKKMDGFIHDIVDINRWQEYSDKGKGLVDGRGVGRVANEIERII